MPEPTPPQHADRAHGPALAGPGIGVGGADEAELDALLVSRLRRAAARPGGLGDDDARAALSTLIARYQHRLYAICLRMVHGDAETAADLTQDSLLKVIQGLDSYDGRSRLSTWIIRVCMNTCLSYLRSSKYRHHARLQGNEDPDDSGGVRASRPPSLEQSRELPPAAGVELQHERRRVLAALSSLEPEQRGVLILRDVQGLEYEHIADVLGVPIGTVKSRLFRARLALRDVLEGTSASEQKS